MDEVVFRSNERLETLQVQLSLAKQYGKELFHKYSEHSREIVSQAWNSPRGLRVQHALDRIVVLVVGIGDKARNAYQTMLDPLGIYRRLKKIMGGDVSKRDICFCCLGIILGTFIGYSIGVLVYRPPAVPLHMRAVICTAYRGPESAILTEDTAVPKINRPNEVLVQVKAASVQIIDAQICYGYGKTIRKVMSRYDPNVKSDLPVILGRDCSGIVLEIGQNVNRLEIGDEVWLTVPFWKNGTICETVVIEESRVGKKPKAIGFEGATSLPYSGSLALAALRKADIMEENAAGKRILVQGACSPVGCVLTQLLTRWHATLTTSCYALCVPVTKALGSTDIIVFPDETVSKNAEKPLTPTYILHKELELKELFDVIISTKECGLTKEEFRRYCKPGGKVIFTLPEHLKSDKYSLVQAKLFAVYIFITHGLKALLRIEKDTFGEPHMCYFALDKLKSYVDERQVQTVVDKVYRPHEYEHAFEHAQSTRSIGSTVISFK